MDKSIEMLECCEDCSYQCKCYKNESAPTGCGVADEELGFIEDSTES